jgi:hypothetical protein
MLPRSTCRGTAFLRTSICTGGALGTRLHAMSGRVKTLVLVFAGLAWLAGLGVGLSVLWQYEHAPGAVIATAPSSWPPHTGIGRVPGRATLVMLVHPQCPCSRASVGELALVMARAQGVVDAHVLFYRPAGVSSNWHETDLWSAAAAIPGVDVAVDEDGAEADRFGVATSGHTLLYDDRGQLQFSGGITGSRGHSGDNAGRSAIVSLLLHHAAERRSTSVFGCSLVDRCLTGCGLFGRTLS